MKRYLKLLAALLPALLLFAVSTAALLVYHKPMKDQFFDLSLFAEDGQEDPVDQKGWTVYIYSEGTPKPLETNYLGSYYPLDYPGQTFYYSRVLEEDLDSPSLRIGAANRSVSVFLDDTLIYTDFPELKQEPGSLELPMQEYDRSEPVILSLPSDYQNRILTIAQSSPVYSEVQNSDSLTVFPCEVSLYCGYSYESGLISETSHIMIPAALFFALGTLFLILFVKNAYTGHFHISFLIFAASAMLTMCSTLVSADFFFRYFGTPAVDFSVLFRHLSVTALMAFITVRSRKYFCAIQAAMTGFQFISILIFSKSTSFILYEISFFTLFFSLILCFIQWKKGQLFFKRISKTALNLIICCIIAFYFLSVLEDFKFDLINGIFIRSSHILFILYLLSCIAALTLEVFELEAQRKAELSLMDMRNQLAVESYENLRHQSEELMMIRHDTAKHYAVLNAMAKETPEQIPGYINQLTDQLQNIRTVVTTGNPILDIIINGKMGIAANKGIRVEIVRSEAPKTLPLSDAELCSLIMNILDNALNAVSDLPKEEAYIKMDLHHTETHFLFTCENSCTKQEKQTFPLHKKIPMPEHGYGLKIIYQIMEKWGNMISVDSSENLFKISIAIPLHLISK